MEWDFTPEDVLTGKPRYSVTEFNKDLIEEINLNVAEFRHNELMKELFPILTIMLCISLALGYSVKDFIKEQKKHFPSPDQQKLVADKKFLEEIKNNNKENIGMLKAVIRRRIMDDTSIGIDPGCVAKTITAELMTF